MSTKPVLLVLVLVLVIGAIAYFGFMHKAAAPTTEQPVAQQQVQQTTGSSTATITAAQPASAQKTTTVTYMDTGFSPKTLSIGVGDTVRFVNNSSHKMWVASNMHPTHTDYDGTSLSQHCSAGADTNGGFDECQPIDPGSAYTFTFTKAGTFTYHNHIQASDTGTISVK